MAIKHRARKRFGQNFLRDRHIVEKILRALAPAADENIIEIGPGQGVLTELLIDSKARVHAIEIDRDLAAMLRANFATRSNFTLLENDVLKVDFATLLCADNPARIIGNLPYNISTPLIFHLLKYLSGITDMLFMLQLEVVERMAAQPGTKSYGRLSIMTQYYCQVEKLFNVPAQAFSPAPKVESAIVKLVPHPREPQLLDTPETLEKLVRQAFSQRRKTLRNNLQGTLDEQELVTLNINPGLRPENLPLTDYVRIARHLEHKAADNGQQA